MAEGQRPGFGPQISQGNTGQAGDRAPSSPRQGADMFGSLMQQQQQGHLSKELIHPGDDVKEMLMRTYLVDTNEARDVALTLAKCDEFDMEEEKQLVLYLLSARNSIHGRGRAEYLQGIVGILSPAMMGYKGAKTYDHNKRSGDREPE